MRRREATRVLALAGACALLPLVASRAADIRRIGHLSGQPHEAVDHINKALLRRLGELGWREGENLAIDYHYADGHPERLPGYAAELVARNVELIIAPSGAAAVAAHDATKRIPIVTLFPSDPVALGLVNSLRNPGTNVTGTSFTAGAELFGKQLQLLNETVPRARRIAVLFHPDDPSVPIQTKALEEAAATLGVRLLKVPARTPAEFEAAFATMARDDAQALIVAAATFLPYGELLGALALRHRLPSMHIFREMVVAGGLMSYGISMVDVAGRAAVYVDRILRGARPADLPIEQPSSFEFVINLKAARALGLAVPPSVLARAETLP